MDPLSIACELVAVPSVSSQSNAPVSDVVAGFLQRLDFAIERQEFTDPHGVPQVNIIARKGAGSGGLAYFAHSDVVPAATWSCSHGPFTPTVRDGRLYGRGSCDMKGSVAAFLAAVARVPAEALNAPVYVTVTADEEIGMHGAKEVASRSRFYAELVDQGARGIVGEPTELEVVYAHKGMCGFRAVARGKAAHSSTREGLNANWAMIPFLQEMHAIHRETLTDPAWLHAEFDPPEISWNLSITDHAPALNITAPESVCRVGFRPMPGQRREVLVDRARRKAAECGLEFSLLWDDPPLMTDPQSQFIQELLRLSGKAAPRTVAFGTDGCCFTAVKEIAVLGPGSVKQAHKDDEWIALDQLHAGTDLYERLIRRWCTAA
jgi:acetylornithine deacetylase